MIFFLFRVEGRRWQQYNFSKKRSILYFSDKLSILRGTCPLTRLLLLALSNAKHTHRERERESIDGDMDL